MASSEQAAPIGASTNAMRANWDHTASTYNDFVTGQNFMGPSRDRILAAVATFAKEHKGQNLQVLDLASGPGDPAIPIAQALPQAQVTATDLAPKMCQLAAQRARSLGLTNITAQPADAQNLQDFGDSSFDLVTCQYAVFALPDCDSALREVLRVLKPGGLFVATCWGKDSDTMNFTMGLMARFMPGFKAPDMSPFYHDHQFISRMTGVGFQQVDSYKSHSLSHTLGWRTAIKPAEGLSLAHDQAKAEVFHHRLESSADAIASMQFGQGGLMEMPFKKAGVAYGKAREYMEQVFKERGWCTNGDLSHVVMNSSSLMYMACKA